MKNYLFSMDKLTAEQVTALYALAEKFKVGINLWQNSPSPMRDSSTWAVSGGFLRVVRFLRHLRAMR